MTLAMISQTKQASKLQLKVLLITYISTRTGEVYNLARIVDRDVCPALHCCELTSQQSPFRDGLPCAVHTRPCLLLGVSDDYLCVYVCPP